MKNKLYNNGGDRPEKPVEEGYIEISETPITTK